MQFDYTDAYLQESTAMTRGSVINASALWLHLKAYKRRSTDIEAFCAIVRTHSFIQPLINQSSQPVCR